MSRILIAHSNPSLLDRFREILEDHNFWILTAADVEMAKKRALSHQPDLIFIEQKLLLNQPSSFIKELRQLSDTRPFPVLLLLPQMDLDQALSTFSVNGADGLLPEEGWLPIEVLDAVQMHLQKFASRKNRKKIFHYGHLEFDSETRSIRMGDSIVPFISKQLFELAWFLAKEAAQGSEVLTRTRICKLWKHRVRDREVDVAISRLKSRLPFMAPFIRTVPGKGYMLSKPLVTLPMKDVPQPQVIAPVATAFPLLKKAA